MIIVQIFRKLPFASLIVLVSAPDLELDDKPLPKVIDDNVCAPLVTRLRLDVIISCAVYDRFQEQQKKLASVILNKPFVILTIDLIEGNHMTLSISSLPSWTKQLLSRFAMRMIALESSSSE